VFDDVVGPASPLTGQRRASVTSGRLVRGAWELSADLSKIQVIGKLNFGYF